MNINFSIKFIKIIQDRFYNRYAHNFYNKTSQRLVI